NPDHARAATLFRLGTLLHEQGRRDDAQTAFAEAKRLRPESWNFKRQAWHLEEPGKSGGAEFWAEVKALGDRPYYPRHQLRKRGAAEKATPGAVEASSSGKTSGRT